jgi:ABC-type transport system involved in multi-copper enzyme maturation permease subunit
MFAAINISQILALGALAVLAFIALGISMAAVAGLFQARSLIRREFSAYFLSPIAYVVLVVFLAVTGRLFYLALEQLTTDGPYGIEYPMRSMLGDERFWLVFLFIPPLLTMRLFAEERSTGTLEMLMTAPVRDWQVVLSKYLACFGFYVVLWLPTLIYLPVLQSAHPPVVHLDAWTPNSILMVAGLGLIVFSLLLLFPHLGTSTRAMNLVLLIAGIACTGVGGWLHYHRDSQQLLEIPVGIDPMPVLSSYLGLALAGAMFLAIGILVSSWVRSQMVAALISLVISLVFILAAFWRPTMDTGSTPYQVLYFFSVPLHFSEDFSRGLVDTRHVTLYLSVTVFCLFLTIRSLESRRWR